MATSVDGSKEMIEYARRNLGAKGTKEVKCLTNRCREAPFRVKRYLDAIVSRDVIWTLYDPQCAFERWRELLKPGGRIVIYDGNYHYAKNSFKRTVWRYFANILIFLPESTKTGRLQ